MRRRIAPVILVVAVFYGVVVGLRLHQHDVLWFVHLGHEFLTSAHTSSELGPQLGWQSRVGYDGQYYFAVAVDPVHAKDYIGPNASIVYGRLGLPLAAGILGGSSATAVPYAMLAIELAAVLALTAAVALWLRGRGLSPWWAAVLGLYPGLVFTVLRDLTEAPSYALVALGILALQRRRTWPAAALLAAAVLTREAAFPFALAGAAFVGRPSRDWRRALWFAAVALVPALVWHVVAVRYTGQSFFGQNGSRFPFAGFAAWPFDQQHHLILAVVIVPALLALAGTVVIARSQPVEAALVAVTVLLYVVFLSKSAAVDWMSAGRDALPCVLAAVYCLGSGRRRAPFWAALVLWSLPVFLLVALRLALPGFDLMTQ